MTFDEDTAEVLKGSDGSSKGGLVVKGGLSVKKKSKDSEATFKKPSIFGLDKLADKKREERKREERDKKDRGDRDDKNYRRRRIETPTNTGGVSDKYYERRREKQRREDDRKDYYSSRDSKRDRERGSRYDWENEDDDDRRDRKRDRRGTSERGSWETPTPSRTPRDSPYIRSERSERKRSDITPLPTPSYKYNDWNKDGKKLNVRGRTDEPERNFLDISIKSHY